MRAASSALMAVRILVAGLPGGKIRCGLHPLASVEALEASDSSLEPTL